jgi:lipid-A-disaccharide synthase
VSSAAPPRPRLVDHLHVLALLAKSLLAGVPFVLFALVAPVVRPILKARLRARLRQGALDAPAEPPLPDPARWAGKTVFVVAGEPSGDRLAAPVIAALRRLCPGVRVRGYAGPACAAAGMALDRDLMAHAVIGVFAVVRSLGTWWRLCAEYLALLRETPPDLLLTVDFPGLNCRLARWAKKRGVRTVHLVAPGVWAYGGWRVFRWRRALDHLLALLPFEPALYAGSGIRTTYVGHPLFEAPFPPPTTPPAWPGAGPCTVELLPGSRKSEIDGQTPLLLEAAARIEAALPRVRFAVRLAEEAHRARFDAAAGLARARPTALEVGVGPRAHAAPVLAALASSGTVTAELAAALVPMAVTYRVTWLTRVGAFLWLTAPYFCLANLVAGRRVVPERLVTRRSAAARLAADLLSVAGSADAWTRVRADLHVVRRRLEVPHVAERAARAVLAEA